MKKITSRTWILAGAVMFLLGITEIPSSNASHNTGELSTDASQDTGELSPDASQDTGDSASDTPQKPDGKISGSILLVGSTSMQAYVSALAEGYMNTYPDVTVAVEFTGSGAGIEAVLNGTADIGNSSRNLTDREKAGGAVENVVAIEGIAVCVGAANTVTELTRQQLACIYTGEINNWSEVGGEDVPIVLVGREAGSGTRSAFEEFLGIEGECDYVNVLDSNGAVMARVASTPGAIGYISLNTADERVVMLKLDGAAPTAENIRNGRYALSSPLVMATMGDISEQNELVQSWFAYVHGKEGKEIAVLAGVIPIE